MNYLKYFFQFLGIFFLFLIFKILGLRFSSMLSSYIFKFIGPLFRSRNICKKNLKKAFPNISEIDEKKIINEMWCNYGKIFAEYIFIKNFRISKSFQKKILVENQHLLEKLKKDKNPVIFISGHFNNFELMAMHIERSGLDLAAIYRPLNNFFLNPFMEKIRKKYICKKQIKKGISGTKEILKLYKKGVSIALMIDQRVSEGKKCNFFNEKAFTTTIPAQFVKKFKSKIIPIYIERTNNDNFKIIINDPLEFKNNDSIDFITLTLNQLLEKMIMKNPSQWIWTHDR